MSDYYDVVIVGGGMIGLSLAAALSQANFSIAVIESKVPHLHWKETDYSARVSAIHLGTQRFLESIYAWPAIRAQAYSPLEHMVVWDAVGGGCLRFDASEIGKEVLGYIVENREIVRVLWEQCEASSNIDLMPSTKVQSIEKNYLTSDSNKVIEADLMIGADGAHSWLREHMDTTCFEKPYHHDSLVAVIETEKPHQCTAFQPFLSTGPLGVLPLSNAHHMAIVWSADPERAKDLLSMSLENFNRELMNALNSEFGTIHCLLERKTISLRQRHVSAYVQQGRALVGDAAHTIHPLAGQGANLGFMDVACLAKVLTEAKANNKNIGCYKILRQYERWRRSENTRMLCTMSGFKSVFSSRSPITVSMRSWGFDVTDRFSALKKYFMRAAVHENFP